MWEDDWAHESFTEGKVFGLSRLDLIERGWGEGGVGTNYWVIWMVERFGSVHPALEEGLRMHPQI